MAESLFEREPTATGSNPESSEANQEQIITDFGRLRQIWSEEAGDYQINQTAIDGAIAEFDTI